VHAARTRTRFTLLRAVQLDATQADLKKAHGALEAQQSANSELKLVAQRNEEHLAKLTNTLQATATKLDTEVSSSTTMKSQLEELKMEYIAAGDKLEQEQTHIRQLSSELASMEAATNANARDKKAAQARHRLLVSTILDVAWH
jgi:chromosome segregation ATPase